MTATRIDRVIRGLSRSANNSRLWLALAAVAFLAGGSARRGAIRGVGALAATSLITNAALKPATRRRRPAIELTPVFRRLNRPPRTTSFPSGHAASAAAFATGMALENPALGAMIAPLAGTVGYSRVHVGVHHVSDVVAGAALGAGVAMATQWWWPIQPQQPTLVRQRVAAPEIHDGDGLLIVVNKRSGAAEAAGRAMRDRLPRAAWVEMVPGMDLDRELARRSAAHALGAVGGDGTIAAVAAAALRSSLPLAVFPAGTFNHFARDVGLDSLDATIQALRRGDAVAVDVAAVNGTPFLNTAVIGAYPDMVRQRKELESRLGKHPAMAIAAGRVLRHQEPMRLLVDGEPIEAWMLFVGNGVYRSRGPAPAWRTRLDDGWLDVKYLRADVPLSRARTVLSTLAGLAELNGVYKTRLVTELRVESRSGLVPFAHDGEAEAPAASFHFVKLPGTLVIYRPPPGPVTGPT